MKQLHNDRLDAAFMRQLSWFLVISTFIYFFAVTFLKIPKENFNNVGTIIGFLMGVVVGNIMGTYFASSKSKSSEQSSSVTTETDGEPTTTSTKTDTQS